MQLYFSPCCCAPGELDTCGPRWALDRLGVVQRDIATMPRHDQAMACPSGLHRCAMQRGAVPLVVQTSFWRGPRWLRLDTLLGCLNNTLLGHSPQAN